MAAAPAAQFNGPVTIAARLLALAVKPTRAGLSGLPATPMEWLG